MRNTGTLIVGGLLGVAVGAAVTLGLTQNLMDPAHNNEGDGREEKQPLYWVAPMDPNYKRDKPGKSPMGMDLIPVYKNDSDTDASPGTVTISPDVVNNLGVRTIKASMKSLASQIKTVGYVRYDEDRLVHIHPRVTGWIEQLHVKAAGDPVTQGQPLYELYSPQLVNAQEELILALNRKNYSLIQAAQDRLLALQLSSEFIDQLKRDKTIRQRVTFYAPQSGVLDNLNIREGYYVTPDKTLMSIGNLEEVWVEAEVFERQASLVREGQTVDMTLDYLPGHVWQGKVDYVYPTLDPTTRTARVRLRFANTEKKLKPNMFAQVLIYAFKDEEVLTVPREAVIRTGNQDRVVLALGEGRFKSVAVKVGHVNNSDVQILDGLKDGESVVTSAQFLLDSESSKSSDFKRMHHGDEKPASVWVAGRVHNLYPEQRKVYAAHEAIEAWDWPPMIMDFVVADAVDLSRLEIGASLHMELTRQGGDYQITGVHLMDKPEDLPTATTMGSIKAIDAKSRTLTIHRNAIEKWNRPPATVDFLASDAIDIEGLAVGDQIEFTFEIYDGEFILLAIKGGDS